jgi:2-polyprenyl-6-hydroxyphenyl methylase/3-demethylubiquinone-9 3-methyltransferase
VALRAAEAGAIVVASDLTPHNFAAGRRMAERAGLRIRWVEADAEDLPFADAKFDIVTSSVGAMWAPDHQRVADELVRVCRPGGTIRMINFAAGAMLARLPPHIRRPHPAAPALGVLAVAVG